MNKVEYISRGGVYKVNHFRTTQCRIHLTLGGVSLKSCLSSLEPIGVDEYKCQAFETLQIVSERDIISS